MYRKVPPNYGALLGHLMGGALTPLDDGDAALTMLQELARLHPSPPRRAVQKRRREA